MLPMVAIEPTTPAETPVTKLSNRLRCWVIGSSEGRKFSTPVVFGAEEGGSYKLILILLLGIDSTNTTTRNS